MLILSWSVLVFLKVAHRWLYWKKVFPKPCSYQFVERTKETPDWGGWLPPRCQQGPPCPSRGQWRVTREPGWHFWLSDFTRTAHGACEVTHGYLPIYVAICSTGTVLEQLFVLETARCYSLITLTMKGSSDYMFTSYNISLLCSFWEMNQQFGYTSVEYLESEWKILSQRTNALFYVKTETNPNNWL